MSSDMSSIRCAFVSAFIGLTSLGCDATHATDAPRSEAHYAAPPPAVAAVAASDPAAMDARLPLVVTGAAEGVIVPASRMGAGYWTPDLGAVTEFERGLREFVRRARPAQEPELYTKLEQYRRQYLGIVVDGRSEELTVFFFCRVDDEDAWRKHFIMVHDGGSCFFDVRFNMRTREYVRLSINGEA